MVVYKCVHNEHKVSIIEHKYCYASIGDEIEMLNSVELSARELGMLKLMVDFFADKPELTAKIESYTTAHYALSTTYSKTYFGIHLKMQENVGLCHFKSQPRQKRKNQNNKISSSK